MPTSRPVILLCAAAITLTCAACTAIPPVSTSSTQPERSIPDISVPDTTPPSVSAPESAPLEEPSVPTFAPSADKSKEINVPEQKSEPEHAQAQPQEQAQEQPQEQDSKHASPPLVPLDTYDFSQPVPEREAVERDYFADAAFIGDSRSEGFYLYGVKRGKNLSASGLSVFNLDQKKCFSLGGTSCTALEVLSTGEYTKIYLGFGVNELGYISTDAFYEAYCQTIDVVRACQPTAVIYAQTMAPVNEGRVAATGGKKHLNNDRVRLYNELIRKAATEKCVPLLDVYSLFAVDGALPTEASRDGVHLSGDYCRKQLEYLKLHTVTFEELYSQPNIEAEVSPDETSDIPAVDPVPDTGSDSLLPQPEQDPLLPDPDRPAFAV